MCTYRDPSWNTLQTCTILDHSCTATCVCNDDFGGHDCSLTAADLAARDKVRCVVRYVWSLCLLTVYRLSFLTAASLSMLL